MKDRRMDVAPRRKEGKKEGGVGWGGKEGRKVALPTEHGKGGNEKQEGSREKGMGRKEHGERGRKDGS